MRLLAFVVILAACGGSQQPGSSSIANVRPAGSADLPDAAPPTTTPSPPDVCANRPDDFGPVLLTPELAQARHGAGATTFAGAPSTKDQPIEACGVGGSQRWLMAATCANGSHPFATAMAAAQSRAGNVGAGGRCHSIVDKYVVPCPESSYEVYVDMYMCAPDEAF